MASQTHNSVEREQPAGLEVEAEIRELVSCGVVTNRECQPENGSDEAASNINCVLQRATATSVKAINNLIMELQGLREMLHSERARLQHEIAQYSTLTRGALHSTKVIAESLTQFKKPPEASSLSLADLRERSLAS